MSKYLLQSGNWMRKEKMAVTLPNLPHTFCLYENLNTLSHDDYIPIGTVEYTTKYAELFNITLPENISYPITLRDYLKRPLWNDTYQNVESHLFVKPVKTKVFTGDIKANITESVDPKECVWVSNPIAFLNEYRFYIINKQIVGYSRYDDSEYRDESIDITSVHQMIDDFTDAPIGYSIDVGISDEGELVLIEVNDGWSLGLYPWGNMTNGKYVELITKRWKELLHLM